MYKKTKDFHLTLKLMIIVTNHENVKIKKIKKYKKLPSLQKSAVITNYKHRRLGTTF